MWQNELSPGADVTRASPITAQMWQVGHVGAPILDFVNEMRNAAECRQAVL